MSGTPQPVAETQQDLALRAEIEALVTMDLEALKQLWRQLYRRIPPVKFRRELLIRGLAYQIQAKALGGLAAPTRALLLKIAAQAEKGTFTTAAAPVRLRPGTRLIRVWNGVTHVVDTLEDGFAWGDQRFGSLSAVARAITGTNWNGFAFFGLTKKRGQA